MIVVLKLLNGQDVMGRCKDDVTSNSWDEIVISDPMYIAEGMDDSYFSTRLEDGMMLSDGCDLTFSKQHVITYYTPAEVLEAYYTRAAEYNKKYVRPKIHSQIRDAAAQMDELLREKENKSILFSKILKDMAGNPSIH